MKKVNEVMIEINTLKNRYLLATVTQLTPTRLHEIRRNVPLVGCASHRLNLAVQSLYEDGTEHDELVKKVNDFTIEINTLKNRHRLATVKQLTPTRLHEIR